MSQSAAEKRRATRKARIGEAPPGTVVGRYQILTRLAAGGMGTVYVGRALGMGGFERLVALKLLHRHLADQEHFVTMFLDEARLAAQIYHPNVVATLDVFEAGGTYCLAMEYVRGLELSGLVRTAIKKRVRIPTPIMLRVGLDAMEGLAAAHSLRSPDGRLLNLVHRDVSPQNILVGTDGVARLTDFGVARAEHRLSTTRSGEFKGKVAYAAPEQLESAQADQRSDLFAMGVVLWEALAHRRLFRGDSKPAIIRAVFEDPIPALAGFDPRLGVLDEILRTALQRDPAQRYVDAAAMLHAFQEAAAMLGVASAIDVRQWVEHIGNNQVREVEGWIREAQSSVEIPLEASQEPRLRSSSLGSDATEPSDPAAISHFGPLTTHAAGSRGNAPSDADELRRVPAALWLGSALVLLLLGAVAAVVLLLREDASRPMAPPSLPAAAPTGHAPMEEDTPSSNETTPDLAPAMMEGLAAPPEPPLATEVGPAAIDESSASEASMRSARRRRGRARRRPPRSARGGVERSTAGHAEEREPERRSAEPQAPAPSEVDVLDNPYRR